MKKLFFLLSIFAIVLSCSSDETSTPVTPPPAPIAKYTITLSAGEGGTVSTTGGEYEAGQTVNVTATPQGEYLFKDWSDGNTNATRTITISSNTTLTANFEKKKYPLTVNIEGEGEVLEEIVNSGRTTDYDSGTTVKLTAVPAEGWEFVGWTGAIESTEESPQIVIGEPKEVTATFEKKKYPLSVNIEGEGEVLEEIVNAGRTTDYDSGTIVKLTAEPKEEWLFTGWSGDIGDIDPTENPIQLSIIESKTVTATFEKKKYPLTVNIEGEGDVLEEIVNAGRTTDYNSGTTVKLTAEPKDEWLFTGWSGDIGDIEPSENPIQLNITESNTITAVFELYIPNENQSSTDLLNFDLIKTKIELNCLVEKTFNDFTFYFNTNQPFINQGILLSRTINPYLVGFIDDNVFGNYILFWYQNNELKKAQIYNNQSLSDEFVISIENGLNQFMSDISLKLKENDFFKSTQFKLEDNIGSNKIEDGIYLSTGFIKTIGVESSISNFKCEKNYSKYFYKNNIGEIGKEYFNVKNNTIIGKIIIYPSDLTRKIFIWDYDSYFYTDTFSGKSINVIGVIDEDIDSFTQSKLKINDPISLIIKDEFSNYKSSTLLKKIDSSNLEFEILNSYENTGFYLDEIYSEIDFNDPKSYLRAFIKDAERYGVDLSNININNFSFNVVSDSDWEEDNFAAYTTAICNDNLIEIYYKESYWNRDIIPYKTDIPTSVKVMWHEFGHDILKLDHVCLGGHIMSGRHQNPKIVYDQSDCDEEYFTAYNMRWNDNDTRINFERAVKNMFSGFEQIKINCSSNKGKVVIY